jgi:hypothetical protein
MTTLLPVLRRFHPNILIVAGDVEAEWALEQIRPGLRPPIVVWSSTETPNFDAIEFGTLLVRQIDSLTTRQQRSLDALLSRAAGDVDVVAVASRHLFPLVTQGKFSDDLYYRLNTVLLDGFEWSTGRIPQFGLTSHTAFSDSSEPAANSAA